jgi:Uma2 family endonuclease
VIAYKNKRYTPEEYLALEDKVNDKSEYFAGEIFAMAGGSFNHDMISGNMYAAFHQFARAKSCFAFTSNMKLLVQDNGLYTYPDAMLLCGTPRFAPGRTDTIINPQVIVEVLSESTENYDRSKKFELYRALETFRDYLLIDQNRVYAEYFHKVDLGGWLLTIAQDINMTLTIPSIGLDIPVQLIYEQVNWQSPQTG